MASPKRVAARHHAGDLLRSIFRGTLRTLRAHHGHRSTCKTLKIDQYSNLAITPPLSITTMPRHSRTTLHHYRARIRRLIQQGERRKYLTHMSAKEMEWIIRCPHRHLLFHTLIPSDHKLTPHPSLHRQISCFPTSAPPQHLLR